jgi:zinc protease
MLPLELSVVGDVDENQVIELARRYLGALPRRDHHLESPGNDLPRLPSGSVKRINVETQIPKAMVVAAWQTDDFWDIGRTRRLSVLADVFSERLRQRIREKLGLPILPMPLTGPAGLTPVMVSSRRMSMWPRIRPTRSWRKSRPLPEDLARNGVTADELAHAVDPILTSIKELRQTNGYWLNSVMTGSERHPQQFEWARSFQDDYAAVTVDELDGWPPPT